MAVGLADLSGVARAVARDAPGTVSAGATGAAGDGAANADVGDPYGATAGVAGAAYVHAELDVAEAEFDAT